MENQNDQMKENQKKLLQTVIADQQIVRCIISPKISKKQMHLKINTLKKSPLLNYLIQLQNEHKYEFNSPQIIINSDMHLDQTRQILQQNSEIKQKLMKQEDLPVHKAKHGLDFSKEQVWMDKTILVQEIQKHLTRNIVQIEKLFNDGLSLNVSFMLSKNNLHHKISAQNKQKRNFWLNSISKRSKAIHSNIVQNGLNFQQTVYQQGYKLHHIFLSSYNSKNQKLSLLENNQAYKMKQLVYVLGMINFNGKLVLDCQKPGTGTQSQFLQNIQYLDKILKENGYKKTEIDNIDDKSYISAL